MNSIGEYGINCQNYKNLVVAIIWQACRDYGCLLRALKKHGQEGLKKAAPQKPCVFLADKRPRRMEKSLDFLLGGIPGRDHADIVRRVPSQIIELSAENGKVCEYAQIADESREPGRILRIDERKYHRARDLHDGKKNDRKRRAE